MQVEVENLEGLGRKLKVILETEKVEHAYQERLKEIAKKTRLAGFRPGKAPLPIIEKKIGQTLRREVASELMQSGFQQAVVDKKLRIAGSPEVKPGEIVKGKPLEFEVIYETYPEVELVDFTQIKIEHPTAKVREEDVNKALERIQRQHAQWNEVNRSSKEGDRVIIDFEGFIEKKPFPGGSAKELPLILGSNEMIPGFEEALIGAAPGELKDVNLTFPENYPLANLANQSVLFKVEVHKVEEAELPALDDEFARKIGSKEAMSFQDLKDKTNQGLEKELNRHIQSLVKKQVLDKLIELNPLEPPLSMIKDEVKHLQEITRQQIMMQQGKKINTNKIELPEDPYLPQAKKRVILGLLIAEVIKKYDIKTDKDKVRRRVEEIVANFPNAEEMANYYQSNKRLMSEIEAAVLEDQVVDRLVKEAQVEEKWFEFEDIFKLARQISE